MSGRSDDPERSPEERFATHINAAMAIAVRDDADPDAVARMCINTARELYDHYGAGEDHARFLTFAVDAGFESAEVEDWLDAVEGDWRDD